MKWLTEKVIPNLQLESVFNASYHSVQIERNPNFSWRKADMQRWPRERGIFYEVHQRMCPSELYVKVFQNGMHEVNYTETHVGHDDDLGHLNLTVAAGKIISKVPFLSILEDVRNSVTNNKLERINLLTKKDLYNITQTFNLNNEAVRH